MATLEIKKEIRQLVDKLPESELNTARRFLQYLVSLKTNKTEVDPILKVFENAPISDEPMTDEERKALKKAREAAKAGKLISHEEAKRRLLG